MAALRLDKEVCVEVVDVIAGDGDVHDVAVLDHEVGSAQLGHTEPRQRDDVRLRLDVELSEAVARPFRRHDAFDEAHLRTGVDPLDGR